MHNNLVKCFYKLKKLSHKNVLFIFQTINKSTNMITALCSVYGLRCAVHTSSQVHNMNMTPPPPPYTNIINHHSAFLTEENKRGRV